MHGRTPRRGLPLHAASRYVGQSMPRLNSIRTTARFCALLAFSLCLGAKAQGRDAPANQDEKEFQALLKQGFELHQQARFTEAIPVLERARKLEPQDYFANLLLGIDLLRTGKPLDAVP